MTIAPDYPEDFYADDIIEFWRSWDGGASYHLFDHTCFFVRDADYTYDNGHELIALSGHDTTGLLERRRVAWFSTVTNAEGVNTYTKKTAPADAIIWQLFNENFGAGVVGLLSTDVPASAGGPVAVGVSPLGATPLDRQMSVISYPATQPATGPNISSEGAWKSVLSVMRDAANASINTNSIRVIFDVVYTPFSASQFEFKIWIGSRGTDRTAGDRPVVFSLEHENVNKISMKKVFSDEVTWMHVGGSGQGALRITQGVLADNFKRSRFYPIEGFVENTKTADYNTLASLGKSELYSHRPRGLLTLDAKDGPWTTYGRDYAYGDMVLAKHRGVVSKCRVPKVRISLKEKQETLALPMESNTDPDSISIFGGTLWSQS